jgi:Tol biopolymer transport system component/predicted Ser/Thr protein kinase
MSLRVGARLGRYEIVAPIGAGGMGEVYRARDTRLDRTVAIKVLPEHLASNAELRQRFEWEARIVSSLNHPHICTLYDVGHDGGIDFLVMEYLEGETLAQRVKKGPMPLDQILGYGIEVADALDKAHRYGVAHRDVKPGNIMLTKSGTKLLDFGLAKINPPIVQQVSAAGGDDTIAAPLTVQGAILGTLEYMAPEQLQAKGVDSRTDVFALGCVLFEMATGRKAFEGESTSALIAAILQREPKPVSALRPGSPPALDRIVQMCLVKDPEARWQSAHDVQVQLRWLAGGRAEAAVPESQERRRRKREYLAWTLALVLLFLLIGLGGAYYRRNATLAGLTRSAILPPENARFNSTGDDGGPVVISPDGRTLAFVTVDGEGRSGLWIRAADGLQTRALPDTDGAIFPFWSPDSQQIGFFAGGKLKTVAITGGLPMIVCNVRSARGGSWNREGTIILALDYQGGIFRVPASGGEPVPVTTLQQGKQSTHRWPHFLPDGRRFLYLSASHQDEVPDGENTGVFLASLDGKENRPLLRSRFDAVYASGYLLFVRDKRLMAQPFDVKRGRLTGDPLPTTEQVLCDPSTWKAVFSASENGLLAYQDAASRTGSELVWYDGSGAVLGSLGPPSAYVGLRLSPNGQRLAIESAEGPVDDIWIHDIARGARSRLALGRALSTNPAWSPDGSRIVFAARRSSTDPYEIHEQVSHGAEAERLLLKAATSARPTDWSPDGRFILYNQDESPTPASTSGLPRMHIWVLPLFGDKKPFPFIHTKFTEWDGQFSPDGRWIAYCSNESDREEVYIAAFSGSPPASQPGSVHPAAKWQVSVSGGTRPKWSRDGRRLYYLAGTKLTAAEISVKGNTIETGALKRLFTVPMAFPFSSSAAQTRGWRYDIADNGARFVANVMRVEDAPPITLVTNWSHQLAARPSGEAPSQP